MTKLTQEQINAIVALLETLKESDSELIGTRPKDR